MQRTILGKKAVDWLKGLGPWLPLIVAGLLAISNFLRFAAINPVILGDEYIYLLNVTSGNPWTSPGGDFANYLFNFVYQPIAICGNAAYTCAKAVNSLFFGLTLLMVNGILGTKVGLGVRLATIAALGVSPLAIYSSLMLPETLFIFLLFAVLVILARFSESQSKELLVGAALVLGLATLTKPHAWLFLVPLSLWLVIHFLHTRWTSPSSFFRLVALSFATLLGTRLVGGFMLGGPQSIGLAGQYSVPAFGTEAVLAPSTAPSQEQSYVSALFSGAIRHLFEHSTAVIMVSGLTVGVLIAVSISRQVPVAHRSLSLLALISTSSLAVIFSIFSSWVTLSGDDHSSRLLFRYYEYAVAFGIVVAIRSLASRDMPTSLDWKAKVTFLSFGFLTLIAFGSPITSNLTVQIADAPLFAGLIVDLDLLTVAPILVFGSYALLTILWGRATLRKALIGLSCVFLALVGLNTFGQYEGFRAKDEPHDVAGKLARSVLQDPTVNRVLVVAPSRFEATGAAFWINEPSTNTRVFGPGSWVSDADVQEFDLVVAIGDVAVIGSMAQISGPGYSLHWVSGERHYRFYLGGEEAGYALDGFTPKTNTGVWTVGTVSTINFEEELPDRVTLELELEASPAAAGKNVSFVVGDDTLTAEIGGGAGVTSIVLPFENTSPSKTLRFEFDEIKSELELGIGFDSIPKGLRIVSLKIVD